MMKVWRSLGLFVLCFLLLSGCGRAYINVAMMNEVDSGQKQNEALSQQNEQTPSENDPTQSVKQQTDTNEQSTEQTNEQTKEQTEEQTTQHSTEENSEANDKPSYHFPYPDAVRGIYVSENIAGGQDFKHMLHLVDSTALNAMVINVKDDLGHLTFRPDKDHPLYEQSENVIKDVDKLLKTLEEHQIYPIARIVVFKDSIISRKKPEWSYLNPDGSVWQNKPGPRGESFINPFLKEVWDYNLQFARLAAEKGFKEIQFDYVRFPEGFEHKDEVLQYSMGDYKPIPIKNAQGEIVDYDMVQPRVQAVTDFVAYAEKTLKEEYDVEISVDIFGYSATIPEAPGIGQNFTKISRHVDVISSMIYPSHWTSYFGIRHPDLEPYRLIQEYIKVEKDRLRQMTDRPISRPWLQDFTASYLPDGTWKRYGVEEVEAQIRALNEAGVWEFLLWNSGNNYTKGVNYLPIGPKPYTENEKNHSTQPIDPTIMR